MVKIYIGVFVIHIEQIVQNLGRRKEYQTKNVHFADGIKADVIVIGSYQV